MQEIMLSRKKKMGSARYKSFGIPTKSFLKIGITKIFCYNSKMFSFIDKTFGCSSKIFGYCNKKKIVRNFVAVTKPFFPCGMRRRWLLLLRRLVPT